MSKLSAKKLGQFFAKLYCLYILGICRDTSGKGEGGRRRWLLGSGGKRGRFVGTGGCWCVQDGDGAGLPGA